MPPKGLASEIVCATRAWPPISWTYQRATTPAERVPDDGDARAVRDAIDEAREAPRDAPDAEARARA